jgi:hypothetical protein
MHAQSCNRLNPGGERHRDRHRTFNTKGSNEPPAEVTAPSLPSIPIRIPKPATQT